MADGRYDVVAFHPATRRGDCLRVISDELGVLALIRSERRCTGDWFDDPDDDSEGFTSSSVEWSRSGTAYPGSLRSNDLDATCRAIAAWEQGVDLERRALIEDYRDAAERAEYACAELSRLPAEAPQIEVARARERVQRFLTEKQRLLRLLHDELEVHAATLALDDWHPEPSPPLGAPPVPPDELRRRVVAHASGVLGRVGVTPTVRPDVVSAIAARFDLAPRELERLWAGDEGGERMRGEMMLETARDGLRRRAHDDGLIGAWNLLAGLAPSLATAEGRQFVLRRLFERIALHDFDLVSTSMSWRGYLACVAGVAETGGLSDELSRRLRADYDDYLTRMARFYENALALVGFRLHESLRGDHRAFALAVTAVVDGLGIAARNDPTALATVYGEPAGGDGELALVVVRVVVERLLVADPGFDAEAAIRRLTHGLESDTVIA